MISGRLTGTDDTLNAYFGPEMWPSTPKQQTRMKVDIRSYCQQTKTSISR